MASRNLAVVLSDIHIGNGARTCWYQPSVHDDYISAIVQWIIRNRDTIREVYFLGDLFDVWTYPPSVRPPTMSEIIKANPRLLGRSGPFAQLVTALPTRVNYMLGNHDGTLTSADVAQLNASLGGDVWNGEAIRLVDQPVVVLEAAGARTALAHGHTWCMFNAPDEKGPWHGLPLGHVISRAIAYKLDPALKRAGKTAADLAGMGNPAGLDKRALAEVIERIVDVIRGKSDDISGPVIDYICDPRVTGLPKGERILLPVGHGQETTAAKAAHDFVYLLKHWEKKLGRREDAERAAVADFKGDFLAWFAQRVALQTSSDLVVLGHTHEVVSGIAKSPISYVNSGYECVSRPDLRSSPFSFTVVDVPRASARLYKVTGPRTALTVEPTRGKTIPQVTKYGAEDYSCYVRITNRTGRPLTRVGDPTDNGSFWVVPPPKTIPVGGRAHFWLQDRFRGPGARGSVVYSDGVSARPLVFSFACPVSSRNTVTSPVDTYETRTSDGKWRAKGPDIFGHPLQVRFDVQGVRYASGTVRPPTSPPAVASQPTRQSATVHPELSKAEIAHRYADYKELARTIMNQHGTKQYPRWRGEVLCDAHLVSNDGAPLVATQATAKGLVLKGTLAHLTPLVQTVRHPRYGEFQYVFIHPDPEGAAPPVTGGFLFLPPPNSPDFRLVTFNVASLTGGDYRRRCKNEHHAEMQLRYWIRAQAQGWQQRIGCLLIQNGSRKPKLAYSPCNACADDMAKLLVWLDGLPSRPSRVKAAFSWGDLYTNRPECGHPLDRHGVELLVRAGWKLQGPVPAGVNKKVGQGAPDPVCLDPAPARPATRTIVA